MNKILLFLFLTSACWGQVVPAERFELTLEGEGNNIPAITTLGTDGVLIFNRIFSHVNDQIELIKLDTSFNKNWQGYISIDRTMKVSAVYSRNSISYFLLQSVVYGNFNFTLIELDAISGNYINHQIKNIIPFSPTGLVAFDRIILIAGYFNNRPVIIHFDTTSGKSRLLPGFFNEPGQLNQINFLDDSSIDVIVTIKSLKRQSVLWVRNYSMEGDLNQAVVIEPNDNRNLNYGKSIRNKDGSQMVVGGYGRNPDYNRGIFISEINPEGKYKIQYHSFSELENFFTFMKPSRERRVKERIKRRNAKGKINRMSYKFLIDELIYNNGEFIMLGEAYYPKYLYTNPWFSGILLIGNTRTDRIFDGYRFTHGVILGFDADGNILWDNSIEMNDIKTYTLDQIVKMGFKDQNILLTYLVQNTLKTKSVREGTIIEPKKEIQLNAKFISDNRDRDTEKSLLNYWYSSNFIASGVQYLKEFKNDREAGIRKVFFITKVKF